MNVTYEYSPLITSSCLGLLYIVTLHKIFSRSGQVVLPYLLVILVFTGTTYGTSGHEQYTLYSRGSGQLLFSFINLFLILLFVFSFVQNGGNRNRIIAKTMFSQTLIFFSLYILIYYWIGLFLGKEIGNVFSTYGMLNILNILMFFLVLLWNIYNKKRLEQFKNVFVLITSLMAVYGLVRFSFFGGDPANFYKTYEKAALNISFFDIGQNALFCILGCYSFLSIRKNIEKNIKYKLILLSCLTALNIILSFRRTAWVGLVLVIVWLVATSNLKRKMVLTLISIVVIIGISVVAQNRFRGGEKNQSMFSDFTNKSGDVEFSSGRFYELQLAVDKVWSHNSFVGLGPWGVNKPRVSYLFSHDFVHSSFVHVFIKTGLVGLCFYFCTLCAYLLWWSRKMKYNWYDINNLNIATSFFCGFLFILPDIMNGTPLIIFRHSQIIAMVLAIPLICYQIDKKRHDFIDE